MMRNNMASDAEKASLRQRKKALAKAEARHLAELQKSEAERLAEAEKRWQCFMDFEHRHAAYVRFDGVPLRGQLHLMPVYRPDLSERPLTVSAESDEPDADYMTIVSESVDGYWWRTKHGKQQRFYGYPYSALKACGSCARRVRPCGGLRGLSYSRVEINPTRTSWRFEHQDAAMVCVRCFNARRHENQQVRRVWEIQALLTDVRREIRNGRN